MGWGKLIQKPWIFLVYHFNNQPVVVTVQLIMCMGHQGLISQRVYEHIILIFRKLSKSYYDSDGPIRSQICTCHDSLAVMTCAKLWSDQIIIFFSKCNMDHEVINCLWNSSQAPWWMTTASLSTLPFVEATTGLSRDQTVYYWENRLKNPW